MNVIETLNVSHAYHGKITALKDISLAVREKDICAVIGSNGSGKSTLLQVINGLVRPDSGTVRFRGTEVSDRTLANREFHALFRGKVGYVFQNSDVQLFCPTVRDDILFGPLQLGLSSGEAAGRADEVMGMLGIEALADRPPTMLSGGEKKRVAIGTVLAMNPEVLLFDEPMSGLDPRTQSFIIELFFSLNVAGKTIVFATHDLELVNELQPRVAVLSEDHGLARVGSAADILADHDLLVGVNLVHSHAHRHGRRIHRHTHGHFSPHDHHDH